MTNSEYYGFTNDGKFTKNIDQLPKMLYNMNSIEFLKWLRKEKQLNLTTKEKMFLMDFVSTYAGLINVQTVTRICDVARDSYYLKFKDDINSSNSSNTFSCFHGMFTELEVGKDYNIRKLLGKDC